MRFRGNKQFCLHLFEGWIGFSSWRDDLEQNEICCSIKICKKKYKKLVTYKKYWKKAKLSAYSKVMKFLLNGCSVIMQTMPSLWKIDLLPKIEHFQNRGLITIRRTNRKINNELLTNESIDSIIWCRGTIVKRHHAKRNKKSSLSRKVKRIVKGVWKKGLVNQNTQ